MEVFYLTEKKNKIFQIINSFPWNSSRYSRKLFSWINKQVSSEAFAIWRKLGRICCSRMFFMIYSFWHLFASHLQAETTWYRKTFQDIFSRFHVEPLSSRLNFIMSRVLAVLVIIAACCVLQSYQLTVACKPCSEPPCRFCFNKQDPRTCKCTVDTCNFAACKRGFARDMKTCKSCGDVVGCVCKFIGCPPCRPTGHPYCTNVATPDCGCERQCGCNQMRPCQAGTERRGCISRCNCPCVPITTTTPPSPPPPAEEEPQDEAENEGQDDQAE